MASDVVMDSDRMQSLFSLDGNKPQDVLTPDVILDPLRDMWGRIAFDPFGSPRTTIADHTARLPDDGQMFVWPDGTYGNPAYRELRRALVGGTGKYPTAWDDKGKPTEWTPLDPAAYYLAHPDGQHKRWCFLVPVRTHRQWWRRAVALPHVEVLELDPIAFVGHTSKFPAPLCLMFTATPRETVAHYFGHLGDLR